MLNAKNKRGAFIGPATLGRMTVSNISRTADEWINEWSEILGLGNAIYAEYMGNDIIAEIGHICE